MFINKIGMEHLESGMNCRDYGFAGERVSYVCDGYSEESKLIKEKNRFAIVNLENVYYLES